MLTEGDIVKLVFGLKIQHLRREAQLSYQQLSDRTGLALSYLHGIEKGKKYPKADKIFVLAKALQSDYNYLVSLEPDKRLKPIVDLLRSDFLKIFPLETFGISTGKLLELLIQAPDKVNAFISTILKITRNFNMQGEDFYKAALRSYQDLHDNYFPEIEKGVRELRQKAGWTRGQMLSVAELEAGLWQLYGLRLNRDDLSDHPDLQHLRSVYAPENQTLYLGAALDSAQERFLLAKELGFQALGLQDRPYETRMLEVDSFERLLSNFHASYFSVALLIDEYSLLSFVETMTQWTHWNPAAFAQLLTRFDVSPEMLMQRLANLLPQHLGVKDIFFMRFYTGSELKKFIVTKEIHLSQLHDPHANQLDEHYCRRWSGISSIRQLKARQAMEAQPEPVISAQISRYWGTPNAYFCISVAKPNQSQPDTSTSVTIGLRINDHLRQVFPFLADPAVPTKDVNTSCERCPIEDCGARAAPPIFLQQKRRRAAIKQSLQKMKEELKE